MYRECTRGCVCHYCLLLLHVDSCSRQAPCSLATLLLLLLLFFTLLLCWPVAGNRSACTGAFQMFLSQLIDGTNCQGRRLATTGSPISIAGSRCVHPIGMSAGAAGSMGIYAPRPAREGAIWGVCRQTRCTHLHERVCFSQQDSSTNRAHTQPARTLLPQAVHRRPPNLPAAMVVCQFDQLLLWTMIGFFLVLSCRAIPGSIQIYLCVVGASTICLDCRSGWRTGPQRRDRLTTGQGGASSPRSTFGPTHPNG
jgi:hypothetical protein